MVVVYIGMAGRSNVGEGFKDGGSVFHHLHIALASVGLFVREFTDDGHNFHRHFIAQGTADAASFFPEFFQTLPVLHVQGLQIHFIDFRHALHQFNNFLIVACGGSRVPVIGGLRLSCSLGSFTMEPGTFQKQESRQRTHGDDAEESAIKDAGRHNEAHGKRGKGRKEPP